VAYAKSFVYFDGIDLKDSKLVVQIGTSCRVCPRTDCAQRAAAPAPHCLDLDPNQRGISAYSSAPPFP
jgi:predicted transcriptional regulator